jgi:hypothetical protein
VLDLFTPSNVFFLDQGDRDFGAGGVLVLPDQPGPVPHLAVAAGKYGLMYSLNRDDLGGFHDPDVPANVFIGRCWCGPSYYRGSDGIGRVVTSGGAILLPDGSSQSTLETWTINTSLTPALTLEASSAPLAVTPQSPGFFTTVSSEGMAPNTAIIWAVGRPTGLDNHVTLYAFSGTKSGSTLPLLWSGSAGFWPNLGANANIVPTVANGKVYVAGYRQLAIFGLTAPAGRPASQLQHPVVLSEQKPQGAVFWGKVKNVDGARMVLLLRSGELLQVDLSEAFREERSVVPTIGENVMVNGQLDAHGVLDAQLMTRAKASPSWGADRRG